MDAHHLPLLQIAIFILMFFPNPTSPTTRTLLQDQTTPEFGNKCGNCPCDKPCTTPSPPPPSPPAPVKPPPAPTTVLCPPPPSPAEWHPPSPPYVYISGPPGSIYQVYPFDSGVERRRGFTVSGLVAATVVVIGVWVVGI